MKKILVPLLSAALLMCSSCGNTPSKEEMRAQLEKEIKDSIERVKKEKERQDFLTDSIAGVVAKRLGTTGKGQSHPYRDIDYGYDKHAEIESWAGVVSNRRLTESDIAGMTNDDLCLLRNLIFAVHGYRFKQERFMRFFSHYNWYSPMYSNVSPYLNKIEHYNVNFIKQHEW